MERIKLKVRKGNEDLYLGLYMDFGYKFLGSDMHTNYTYIFMERDEEAKNGPLCKEKEKAYRKLKFPFPIVGFILLAAGIAALWYAFKSTDTMVIVLCGLGGVIAAWAGFISCLVFIIKKCMRKTLVKDIFRWGKPRNTPLPIFQHYSLKEK